MANVIDYIQWRGDLSFDASPFCEVDNYIISKIGCPDYTGIVPEGEDTVPICDALQALFAPGNEKRATLGLLASPAIITMLKSVPDTVRFSSLRLSGFVKRLDFEQGEQFSALTVLLPDGTAYVSFRGTDDTIIAWKENFLMAAMDAVPAQKAASEYLRWAVSAYPGPIIVGGHSKGGNLAVYAAASVPPEVQDRITAVYNNDGPGFRDEFLASEGYGRIRSRVHTIVPYHSIVGNLLTQEQSREVVRCESAGIAAHDGFCWEVLGTKFLTCDALSRASDALDVAIDETIAGMNRAQRTDFIENLFSILTSTGAVYLSDFTENTLRQALEIAKKLKGQKEIPKFISKVLTEMAKEFFQGKKK